MPYKNKDDQRNFERKWLAQRRRSFFQGKSCLFCDSTIKLQLHHPDPKTKKSHNIWSWSEEKRNEELLKCIVLCEKCHKKETREQLRKPLIHGTRNSYETYKCRCDKCRAANTEYQRKRLQKCKNLLKKEIL